MQIVDGLWRGVSDIDQAFVDAHLEGLTAHLVHMRALDDRVRALASWEWHRSGHACAGTKRGVDDLLGTLVDDLVVVGFETNADSQAFCWILFGVCHMCRSFKELTL